MQLNLNIWIEIDDCCVLDAGQDSPGYEIVSIKNVHVKLAAKTLLSYFFYNCINMLP